RPRRRRTPGTPSTRPAGIRQSWPALPTAGCSGAPGRCRRTDRQDSSPRLIGRLAPGFSLHWRMDKTRLEAFSDGVIAILITIMVLELKTPAGASWEALRPLRPIFLAYVLSFVYLGIYWNN